MEGSEQTFPVVEIFGPTIQGEGPAAGTQCAFVRFGGCDYKCAWCDSAPAVLPENVRLARRMTAGQIAAEVRVKYDVPLVVLSGGNPLLHDLGQVVDWLHEGGYRVSVETQGTLWKEWINKVDQVVVSPKPPSAGYGDLPLGFYEFLSWTTVPVAIKVPCLTMRDVEWAGEVADTFPDRPFFLSVVTLMGGLDGKFEDGVVDTKEDILRRYLQVIELAQGDERLKRAIILPQLHALVWGHERGH